MKTARCVLAAAIWAVFGSGFLLAGEFNKTLSIGSKVVAFEDLPGTDGKTHSLDDWKDKKAVVVVFTCNSCPTAVDYEDRIIRFANKFAGESVAVVAVGVNKIAEDSLENMKKKAESKKLPYVWLFDESQKTARDFGANYTPEFFLLDAGRKVVYMGAFDDKNAEKEAKIGHLERATAALLKGEKVENAETLARGCMIRFARKRD